MIFTGWIGCPYVARKRFPVSGFPPVVSSGGYFPDGIVAGRFVGGWARFNSAAGEFPVFPPYLSASCFPDFFTVFTRMFTGTLWRPGSFAKAVTRRICAGFGLFSPGNGFSCPAVCRLSPGTGRNGVGMCFSAGGGVCQGRWKKRENRMDGDRAGNFRMAGDVFPFDCRHADCRAAFLPLACITLFMIFHSGCLRCFTQDFSPRLIRHKKTGY